MDKLFLNIFLYVGLWSVGLQANSKYYLPNCLSQCQAAKQICGDRDTLTLAKVNACAAIDEDFEENYNCNTVCQQNPRTVRFETIQKLA